MNGFVHPFNVHDKNYKIPIDVKLNNLKKMDNRTSEEIKRIIAGKPCLYSSKKRRKTSNTKRERTRRTSKTVSGEKKDPENL
jgi:hypothetical protein